MTTISPMKYELCRFTHGKSVKQSEKRNQWLHADIVGFILLSRDWTRLVAELLQKTGAFAAKLYSFELRRSVDFGTFRKYFFQAVSNSSWGNAGYLVAAEFTETPEFMEELGRLPQSFDIGVIKLDLNGLESSFIIFPAQERTEQDLETINRLAKTNSELLPLVGESISLNKFDNVEDTNFIVNTAKNLTMEAEYA